MAPRARTELRPGIHVPVCHVAPHARTLPEMFLMRAERSAERPAWYVRTEVGWRPTSWNEFLDAVARTAAGLRSLGVQRGDRVAIVGPTGPQWAIYDVASLLAGAIPFGIYPRQSVELFRHFLAHSGARAVFVDSKAELRTALAARAGMPEPPHIITWDDALARQAHTDGVLGAGALARDERPGRAELWRMATRPDPDDTAILIYTSGTTGPPKGAMIAHRHVLAFLSSQPELLELYEDDITLSFLPMAHAAERILSFYGRISAGLTAAYASSLAAVLSEIREVRPTIFGAVPRIFEKARNRVLHEIEQRGRAVRALFERCLAASVERVHRQLAGRAVPARLEAVHAVGDRIFYRRLREAFGGRVRQCIVGAAPTPMEVLELFWAAGMPLYEAYGQTEATVLTHANVAGAVKLGTVGRPIAPMEHRIAQDGEVLVRGPWVFKGYFRDREATAEVLRDGWLHTGDIGEIDEDGFLHITDRKKHLIVTAGGKNIAPANVEAAIKAADPLIGHVHVHGDARPYLVALIVPSPLETLDWAVDHALATREEADAIVRELLADPMARPPSLQGLLARVARDSRFQRRITESVRRGNARLAHVEQVRRIAILDRDFTVGAGEVTPTMKVRRRAVEERYGDVIETLYADPPGGIEVTR